MMKDFLLEAYSERSDIFKAIRFIKIYKLSKLDVYFAVFRKGVLANSFNIKSAIKFCEMKN